MRVAAFFIQANLLWDNVAQCIILPSTLIKSVCPNFLEYEETSIIGAQYNQTIDKSCEQRNMKSKVLTCENIVYTSILYLYRSGVTKSQHGE